ncbi:MAG: TraX family protein [Ruminococcus sp.]
MTKLLSLNRNQLKYLVIVAMLIDHIAWAFVPTASLLGQVMHFIGRLTGPTMAYMLVEGYCHTRSVKKYALRLGIFALISWIPFSYFEYGKIGLQFGVIYTLFLSLLGIWLWDKGNCVKPVKILGIIGLCLLSLFGDWAIFDVLYALFLFVYRNNPKDKWTAFCIITLFGCADIFFARPWWGALFQFGIFMVPLLIQFCYNGESGSKKPVHKWFFYVFYPAHLLVLGLLKWLVLA